MRIRPHTIFHAKSSLIRVCWWYLEAWGLEPYSTVQLLVPRMATDFPLSAPASRSRANEGWFTCTVNSLLSALCPCSSRDVCRTYWLEWYNICVLRLVMCCPWATGGGCAHDGVGAVTVAVLCRCSAASCPGFGSSQISWPMHAHTTSIGSSNRTLSRSSCSSSSSSRKMRKLTYNRSNSSCSRRSKTSSSPSSSLHRRSSSSSNSSSHHPNPRSSSSSSSSSVTK